MGNIHQVVVYHIGKVISGIAVRFNKHLILYLLVLYGYLPEHRVLEGGRAGKGHLLPDNIGRASVQKTLYLLLRQVPAVAVIASEALFMELLQALLCAETVISLALFNQLLCIRTIGLQTLTLYIRSVRPAGIRTLVMLQSHPAQGAVYNVHRALHQTLLVGVLYSQHKLPALAFGGQIRVKACTQVAHMHEPRWAWGESCPYITHGFPSFHFISFAFYNTINRRDWQDKFSRPGQNFPPGRLFTAF